MSSIISTDTAEEFDSLLDSTNNPIVVYFCADWCISCQLFTPTIEKMTEKFNNLKFVKVNVEFAKDVKSRYAIEFVPACIVLCGRDVIHIIYGTKSDELEGILSKVNLDYC